MRTRKRSGWRAASLVLVLCANASAWPATVQLVRTPRNGIQPQALADDSGTVHLIYYQGDSRGGDIYYERLTENGTSKSAPVRVNSIPGSAIAVGTIRGAQLALGKNHRVHVAWNGSGKAPAKRHSGMAFYYSRMDEDGLAFEAQRDAMTFTEALDGGGSVAADDSGRVWLVWHARKADSLPGEAGRAVYVAESDDGGKTFAAERAVSPSSAGACGCCGLKALAARDGTISILFRSAVEQVHRDELWLRSKDGGRTFARVMKDPWESPACPMSSAWLVESKAGTLGAWETAGQVYFAVLDRVSNRTSAPLNPPGEGKRKHPVAVANGQGECLLVWTEGTGWEKGGSLAWQLFKDGVGEGEPRRIRGAIPVWSMPAAFAKRDGNFVIVY